MKTKKFILGDITKYKSSLDKNENTASSIKSKNDNTANLSQGNNSYVEATPTILQNKSIFNLLNFI